MKLKGWKEPTTDVKQYESYSHAEHSYYTFFALLFYLIVKRERWIFLSFFFHNVCIDNRNIRCIASYHTPDSDYILMLYEQAGKMSFLLLLYRLHLLCVAPIQAQYHRLLKV